MHAAKSIWRFIIRHRIAIRDLSLVLAATLITLYFAFAADLFEGEGSLTLEQARFELNEALLVGLVLGTGLFLFAARNYYAQKREAGRRLAAEQHIRELAYQDVLTGLPNRRQFDDALSAIVDKPPREGAVHAVFLLDLNGFKRVNDVYGHGVGDELLIVVAQRMLSAMRDGDMIARFGGDEFAVLAQHLSGPEAATNIALRVIAGLDLPIMAGGTMHRVGAGIGISLLPVDAKSAEEAVRKADVALYRAKAEGQSALRFFEPHMDTRLRERAVLEVALRDAIENDRIEAVFRPTIDLRTHDVVGFEASPRWIDAAGEEVPVERFTAIAEETGLLHILAESILRKACIAAREWPTHVSLAIDLFPIQLKDRLLPVRVKRILKESGLAPERLELEITESAIVADVENAQSTLEALRLLGMRIVLDNFGTGYSSLYHLRKLPLDKVKIDSSFIRSIASEHQSVEIVRALVGLGHGLGLQIAAEGVDATEQEGSLLATGCDLGQGDLIGERLTAKRATERVAPRLVSVG